MSQQPRSHRTSLPFCLFRKFGCPIPNSLNQPYTRTRSTLRNYPTSTHAKTRYIRGPFKMFRIHACSDAFTAASFGTGGLPYEGRAGVRNGADGLEGARGRGDEKEVVWRHYAPEP